MSPPDEMQKSLQERINTLLRGSPSNQVVFNAKPARDELAFHEYQLEIAEIELRVAQARVDELRHRLARLRES
jgi:hypothetical protein